MHLLIKSLILASVFSVGSYGTYQALHEANRDNKGIAPNQSSQVNVPVASFQPQIEVVKNQKKDNEKSSDKGDSENLQQESSDSVNTSKQSNQDDSNSDQNTNLQTGDESISADTTQVTVVDNPVKEIQRNEESGSESKELNTEVSSKQTSADGESDNQSGELSSSVQTIDPVISELEVENLPEESQKGISDNVGVTKVSDKTNQPEVSESPVIAINAHDKEIEQNINRDATEVNNANAKPNSTKVEDSSIQTK